MATINKTIASSGADYTSASLWEAGIPNSSADDHIGTYLEAMTDTTPLAFSISGFTGTAKLSAGDYACKRRGDTTAAELVYSVNNATDTVSLGVSRATIDGVRIIRDGTTNTSADAIDVVGSLCVLKNSYVATRAGGRAIRHVSAGVVFAIYWSLVVGSTDTGGSNDIVIASGVSNVLNIYNSDVFASGGTRAGALRANTSSVINAKNVRVLKAAGATLTNGCMYGAGTWGTSDRNSTTDGTAQGTNPSTSIVIGDNLTTLTVGSEDPRWPSRVNMLAETGVDMSATIGSVDPDGDTVGSAWHKGSDYAVGVPTLSSVSPDNGPVAGGTSVTLTGTNFTDVTGVTFGGDAATNVSVVSDTSITCDTPAHAAGAVSVLATNADGSNTANSAYTYNAAAVLAALGSAVRLRFGDLGFGRR